MSIALLLCEAEGVDVNVDELSCIVFDIELRILFKLFHESGWAGLVHEVPLFFVGVSDSSSSVFICQ